MLRYLWVCQIPQVLYRALISKKNALLWQQRGWVVMTTACTNQVWPRSSSISNNSGDQRMYTINDFLTGMTFSFLWCNPPLDCLNRYGDFLVIIVSLKLCLAYSIWQFWECWYRGTKSHNHSNILKMMTFHVTNTSGWKKNYKWISKGQPWPHDYKLRVGVSRFF